MDEKNILEEYEKERQRKKEQRRREQEEFERMSALRENEFNKVM